MESRYPVATAHRSVSASILISSLLGIVEAPMSESESSQEVTETSMHKAETNDRSCLATLIISFTLFVLKFLIVLPILLIDKCSIFFNTVVVE